MATTFNDIFINDLNEALGVTRFRYEVWASPPHLEDGEPCPPGCYLETNDIADAVAKCEELGPSHYDISIEYNHAA